jgi:AcrR family transcriptional regulator
VPTLNRERIIDTAIQMADRDGLDAVTLRRLAGELGVHVTSLYNHVPTREAVTTGIVDTLITRANLPASPVDWEGWVRAFVAAIGEIAVEHPGAFVALQRRPAQAAAALTSFEVALTAFEEAGMDPAASYGAVKATTYVALAIAIERALSVRGEEAATSLDELSADELPHVHALGANVDPDATWAFTVETLIAGLRTQIDR